VGEGVNPLAATAAVNASISLRDCLPFTANSSILLIFSGNDLDAEGKTSQSKCLFQLNV
jgi:hypothetical protein